MAHRVDAFSIFRAMSIPTSGLAALLVVATFALSSCGSDDGPATATTHASGSGATVVQTVTQTATATAGSTTSQPATTTPATTTSTTPKPAKPKPSTTTSASGTTSPTTTAGSGCGPIEIGIRDGEVDPTYARITGQRGVSCAAATNIVAQWGSERLGIDKALLPLRWSCTKQNVCTNGAARVAFVLEKHE